MIIHPPPPPLSLSLSLSLSSLSLSLCLSLSLSLSLSLGTVYNIPIAIYVKLTHPQHPPIVYVTPTQGMAIQPSQFVDTNGMVYLPYLTEWKAVSHIERGGGP